MEPTHPPVVEHVQRIMLDELGTHLMGILWTGSRAYGDPWPNSDWDFFVIHDQLWRQRRLFRVGHDEIELFLNPVDQIRRELHDQEAATVGMFARGKVVFDRMGTLAGLVRDADAMWRGPRRPWSAAERDQWRYETLDLMKDIEDLLSEDPDAASYLMGLLMQRLLEGWYKAHRYWEPKAKYLLSDLARLSPQLAFQCRGVISHHLPVTRRFEALRALVELVYKPYGGPLETWQTEREPVASFGADDITSPS
ncbi:nucleotidyltransferase domain-containing protein [Sulfobacillus harzensis]|uniref:Nucleotidyltransferase domain-containing protein n=1 Tax=Sulfobacillus harzensis TaxID=2729629 RepID=A0A7Y0L1A8_9FIRM|nr:nucleotidyltransferase domain-containing protein [Sulfobacillus harzensis]NMP21458.1 nucleotidyltransferase domain-containing protein [Sulfobacillus harzensis]